MLKWVKCSFKFFYSLKCSLKLTKSLYTSSFNSGRFSVYGECCMDTGAVLPGPVKQVHMPLRQMPRTKSWQPERTLMPLSEAVWCQREDETARTNVKLTRTEIKPSKREAELCMCPGVAC